MDGWDQDWYEHNGSKPHQRISLTFHEPQRLESSYQWCQPGDLPLPRHQHRYPDFRPATDRSGFLQNLLAERHGVLEIFPDGVSVCPWIVPSGVDIASTLLRQNLYDGIKSSSFSLALTVVKRQLTFRLNGLLEH